MRPVDESVDPPKRTNARSNRGRKEGSNLLARARSAILVNAATKIA